VAKNILNLPFVHIDGDDIKGKYGCYEKAELTIVRKFGSGNVQYNDMTFKYPDLMAFVKKH